MLIRWGEIAVLCAAASVLSCQGAGGDESFATSSPHDELANGASAVPATGGDEVKAITSERTVPGGRSASQAGEQPREERLEPLQAEPEESIASAPSATGSAPPNAPQAAAQAAAPPVPVVEPPPEPPDLQALAFAEVDECLRTSPAQAGETQLATANAVRSFGDQASTRCLYVEPDRVCLAGTLGTARPGRRTIAGVELMLAEPDAEGESSQAWDLTALPVSVGGFSMTVELEGEAPLRVALTHAAFPDLELLVGGTALSDLTQPGWVALFLSDFARPLGVTDGPPALDPTQLWALRISSVGSDVEDQPYRFCISGFRWLDEKGLITDL